MKTLPLRYFPDGILFQKCEPVPEVTDEIRTLAQDMILTMMIEKGIGLAAPQVGKLLRMFVVDVEWPKGTEQADPHVFINPTVEFKGPLIKSVEGCLSFPGETAELERAKEILVRALGLDGQEFVMEADGVLAVAIQHENDHLEGKTFSDRLSWLRKSGVQKRVKKKLRDQKRAAAKKS